MERRAAGALLALVACFACSAAAPTTSDQTALDTYDGAEGCYYNFQHYGEGDRIMTNEPCLNCTCHNRMLMCYLRVCPFTKAIGQDCTVEKRADQCCPIVTCPDVPVDLLTSTSTNSPAEYGSTGLGKQDKYGCSIDGKYFPEGAKVPPMPNKPCEHCYCIRNMTTCVMQECTLHVDGCTPIYHKDVCCPVRYSCDHPEDEIPLLDDMTTTIRPTPGFLLTTTTIAPVTQQSQYCVHDDEIIADGALIKTDKACQHCYCMKGDMVCVVQDCGVPMENEGKNCTSLPPRDGECCPDTYICEGDELATELPSESETGSPLEELTTLVPPRRVIIEGSGYRNEPDELPYTEKPTFTTEIEGSGEEQPPPSPVDLGNANVPEEEVSPVIDEFRTTTANEEKQDLDKITTTPSPAYNDDMTTNSPSLDQGLSTTLPSIEESEKTTKTSLVENELKTTLSHQNEDEYVTKEPTLEEDRKTTASSTLENDSITTQSFEDAEIKTTMSPTIENDKQTTISSGDFATTSMPVSENEIGATISETLEDMTTVLPALEKEVITTVEPVSYDSKQTTVTPTLEDNVVTTTEADKGENTIPDETPEEHPSDVVEPFKTTISDDSITTTPSIYKEPVTTEKHEVTTAFIEENIATERIKQQEKDADKLTTVDNDVPKEDFTTESAIKEMSLPSDEDTKQTTSSPVDTIKQEEPSEFSRSTTETISTTSDNLYSNVESTTLAAEKHEETESTTFVAPNDIARIPGEGDCLVDGITYQNYTIVPSTNKCQTGCRCVSSIIKCDPILCSPPPQDMENMNDCQPIYDSPDSCCPTYVCDNMRETIPPQPHSQMSGTESSVTSKPVSECIGDECHEKPPSSDGEPKPDDCISGSCANDNIVPVHSTDNECEGDKCESPAAQCSGDSCVKEPEITPSKDQPNTICMNGEDCKQEPADVKPFCEGESCQQEPSQFKPICEGDDCKQEPFSDKPACEGDDCKHEPFGDKPACEGDNCRQEPIDSKPVCDGENCKQEPIEAKPTCEGDNCKQQPIDDKPACEGEDCKQEPVEAKPTCEGDDCKQEPIDDKPACEGEDCKQVPVDIKSTCEGDKCKQEPIDVKPACEGEDCKHEPVEAKPTCEGDDCKQETSDNKPACEGEDCKQVPVDIKSTCKGDNCKQEPIDVKPACEGENCKHEPVEAKPTCEGDDCKQEPIDNKPACEGEDCKQVPVDIKPTCEGDNCKQEPIDVKPACEGEDCKHEPVEAKPTCEGDDCKQEPVAIKPICEGEDCKQEPVDAKPTCEGDECKQEPIDIKPACEGEDCKQVPVDIKSTCEGDNCKQEPIDVKPACEGEDCKHEPVEAKPTCEGDDCKQEPIDNKPACEGEDCKQVPVDIKPTCEGKDCEQEPIDVKIICNGEDCKQEPDNAKPTCKGDDCKQEPIDVKPACKGDECNQKPIDVKPVCEGEGCKQEPVDAKPACEGEYCEQEPIDSKPTCEGESCQHESVDFKPMCNGQDCKDKPHEDKPLCEGVACTDAKPDCDHNNCETTSSPVDQTPEKVPCDSESGCKKPDENEVICEGDTCRRHETSDLDTPLTPESTEPPTDSDSSSTDKPVSHQPSLVTEKDTLFEQGAPEDANAETEKPIQPTITAAEEINTPLIETSTSISESMDSASTAEPQYSSGLPYDPATQAGTTISTNDLAADEHQLDSSTPRLTEAEISDVTGLDSTTLSVPESQTSKEISDVTEAYPDLITVDDNMKSSTPPAATTAQPGEIYTESSVESETESPESENIHQDITTTPHISVDQSEITTEQPEQDVSKKPDIRTPQVDNELVSVTETTIDDTNKLNEPGTTSATSIASDEGIVEPQSVESQDLSTTGPKLDDETTKKTIEPSVEKDIVQTTQSIVDEKLEPITESSVSETKSPDLLESSKTSTEQPKESMDDIITTGIPAAQTESPYTYSEEQKQPTTENIELQTTILPDSNMAVTESGLIPESPVTELEAAITQTPTSDMKTSETTEKAEPITTEKDNNMYTSPLYTDVINTETVAPLDTKDLDKDNEKPEFVTESNIDTEAPSASKQPLATDKEDITKVPDFATTESIYQEPSTEKSITPPVRDESVTVLTDHVTTDFNKYDDDQKTVSTAAPDYAQYTDSTKAQSTEIITESPLNKSDEITVTRETEQFTDKPTVGDLSNIPEHITLHPVTEITEELIFEDSSSKSTESSVADVLETSTDAAAVSPTEKQETSAQETVKPAVDEISTPVMTENEQSATEPTIEMKQPETVSQEITLATELPEALSTRKESNTELLEPQELTTQSDNIQQITSTEQPIMLVTEAESKPTTESEPSMSLVTKEPTDISMSTLSPSEEIVTEEPYGKVTESQDSKYTNIAPSESEPDRSVTTEPHSTDQQMSITEIPHDLVYDETPSSVDVYKPIAGELATMLPEEQEQTTESKQEISETTPYFVELDVHTQKTIDETSTYLPVHDEVTTEVETDNNQSEPEITTEQAKDEEKHTETPIKEELKPDDDKQHVTETSLPAEASTSPEVYQTSTSIPELISPQQTTTESQNSEELDTRYGDKDKDKEVVASTQSVDLQPETTVPSIFKETEKPSVTDDSVISQTDKNVPESGSHPETVSPEEEFITATTKATTLKAEEESLTSPSPSDDKFTKPDDKETEHIPSAAPEVPEPGPNEIQPTDETLSPDEEFPASGTSGYGQETDYDDQVFGPGTCRYGGKVYVSAQQIPRDDPCDFCFCFRSDIICLQQSCPPPIHGCREEPIQGFCCPRYECPVSMATTLNVTTTTTTTTTTLPPHFLPHAYKGAAQRRGCQIKGHTYKVGEVVRASSGPCLHCTCGGDGQMKCDPKACTPEPMLRQMIAAAVSSKRRR